MNRPFGPSRKRSVSLVAISLLTIMAWGCDDSVGKCYRVSGQVLVNGAALQGRVGTVLFKPDATRGNSCPFDAVGTIDAQGRYELFTKGKTGAPVGWYKVVVTAVDEKDASGAQRAQKKKSRPSSPPPVHPRYSQESTSGLTVEVVSSPAPDAYDIKLSSSPTAQRN